PKGDDSTSACRGRKVDATRSRRRRAAKEAGPFFLPGTIDAERTTLAVQRAHRAPRGTPLAWDHGQAVTFTIRRVLMPRTRKQPAEKDAITLLKADHQKVLALLGELTESNERATTKREELLAEIERELKIHTTIEEQIFLSRLSRRGGEGRRSGR